MSIGGTIKTYYYLTKPGIIYGNAMTGIAGFLLGSQRHIVLSHFPALVLGNAFVIAGACVFNNFIDRNIDAKMQRTKKRALVVGKISAPIALSYASILTGLGFATLIKGTNRVTVLVALVAFIDYVILYGLAKRHSVHSTLVGTIAGASSIVAGYTAATGHLDATAWMLSVAMACWQMSHFYAIGIYRLEDYRMAGLPILSVQRGIGVVKDQIVAYMLGLVVAITGLYLAGTVHLFSIFVLLMVTFWWLHLGTAGFTAHDDSAWAKRVFLRSLVFLLVFSAMLSVDSWL